MSTPPSRPGNSLALRGFIFALGLLALSWPFGVEPPDGGLALFFCYYMICWVILIVILALMARSIRRSGERRPLPPED